MSLAIELDRATGKLKCTVNGLTIRLTQDYSRYESSILSCIVSVSSNLHDMHLTAK